MSSKVRERQVGVLFECSGNYLEYYTFNCGTTALVNNHWCIWLISKQLFLVDWLIPGRVICIYIYIYILYELLMHGFWLMQDRLNVEGVPKQGHNIRQWHSNECFQLTNIDRQGLADVLGAEEIGNTVWMKYLAFLPCLLSQKWWNRTCLVALRCEHLFARRQKKAWIHTDTWNHFGRPWLLCCHYCQCPLLSSALFFVWSTLAPGVKTKAPSHGNPSWLVCSWSPLRLESLDLGGNGLDPSAAQFPGLNRVWVCQGCSVFFTDVVVSWYFSRICVKPWGSLLFFSKEMKESSVLALVKSK